MNKSLLLKILIGVVAVIVVIAIIILLWPKSAGPTLGNHSNVSSNVKEPSGSGDGTSSDSDSDSSGTGDESIQIPEDNNDNQYDNDYDGDGDYDGDFDGDGDYDDDDENIIIQPEQPSPSEKVVIDGLKDPYIVGINAEEFKTQIKFPVPDKVDHVVYAKDYGVKADDRLDDTVGLQNAIAALKAKGAGTKKLVLPKGDLDIVEGFNQIDYKYGIIIDGIDDLVIDGQGANIYYHGALGFRGMKVVNCKNFQLNNINVDWGTLPFSMGVVQSFDLKNKTAVIKINDGYKVDDTTQVIEYLEYDQYSNTPLTNGNFLYNHNETKHIKSVKYKGNNTLEIVFNTTVTEPPVGTKVAIAHAMHFSESFIVENCTNAKFESINLYSSPGMGFRAYSNKNLYFNRFNAINKPNTDRLLGVTADVLHLKNTAGEIEITNCTFENSHDDAVNIGGHYLRVREINGDTVRALSPLGMWGTFKPSVGDIYELSNIQTLEVIKTLTVTSVEPCYDGYLLKFKEGTEGIEVENALANLTRTPKVLFKNNLIRNKRNRGLLLQSRDVIIENNAFNNVMHGALQLLSEVNNFNECTAPRDVIIRNNKFVNNNAFGEADIGVAAYGPGFTTGAPGAIKNITIENNIMAYSANAALSFKGVSDAVVDYNLIYNPATNPSDGKNNCAIHLDGVKDISLTNNVVYGGTNFGYKSVFIAGGVDIESVKLNANKGIDPTDIFGEEKVLEIEKNNANITVGDNSLNDWNGINANIELDNVTNVHVEEVIRSNVPERDFSSTIKTFWNDKGLYIGFDVIDESIQWNPNSWWLGDGLELFLTTETKSYANTGTVKLTNDDTLQMFVKPNSHGGTVFYDVRTSDKVLANQSKIQSSIWTTSSGYQGEIFIPFDAMPGLKEAQKNGDQLAMSINIGDSDDGDEDKNPMDKYMTFSTVRHPVTDYKMIPAHMTKIILK